MKTIFYELNEVPKRLFDFYAEAKPESAFARLKKASNLFTTMTADVGQLSPWITWPTLHRGVSNVTHKISDLGQDLSDVNKELPSVWNILADNGVSVGVFGSLQSYPIPAALENFKFYVPDTFAADSECFPDKLTAFQKFNLSMVRKNGRNVSSGVAMKEAKEFVKRAPSLGLRGSTLLSLSRQIMVERINKDRLVRRRTSQVELAFDFYIKQLASTQPDVSFFFTNHVASSMHRYWPTIFPKDYQEGKFDKGWLEQWSKEIPHSVKIANQQLNWLMDYANKNNCRLVVLSSMGQAAVEEVEPIHSQVLITDVTSLMDYLGFTRSEWEPRLAMAPRVVVNIMASEYEKNLQKLNEISVNGTKVNYKVLESGDIRFDIMCTNQEQLIVSDAEGKPLDPAKIGISNVQLQDASGSYAYHIPEGILIDYAPGQSAGRVTTDWVDASVLDVAPSLLNQFSINKPSYMSGDDKLFSKDN